MNPNDQPFVSNGKPWFLARPIPVYIIATFCTLQFLGIIMILVNHWPELLQDMSEGFISPLGLVGRLVHPFIFFAAGIALLFLRKFAIVLFMLYFLSGVTAIFVARGEHPGYLSVAVTLGVIVYALRLRHNGILK